MVFTASLIDAVSGIDGPPPPPTTWHGDDAYGTEDLTRTVAGHSVSAKLRRVRSVATEEFVYLRARTDAPVKATLPSPLMLGKWWNPETSVQAYPDPFDAFADAAEILKDEIAELVAPRLRVRADRRDLTSRRWPTPAVRAQYDQLGIGADRMLGEGVEILNGADRGRCAPITFGIHLCKGNSEGRYLAAGAYDAIADQTFPRLGGYDVLLLEYDDERSGGFEPLARTHEHQTVVLGLVSSKNPRVETAAEITDRMMAATEYVALERLALSCQCGFASTAGGNRITPEVQRAKLTLVGEVARRVWSEEPAPV